MWHPNKRLNEEGNILYSNKEILSLPYKPVPMSHVTCEKYVYIWTLYKGGIWKLSQIGIPLERWCSYNYISKVTKKYPTYFSVPYRGLLPIRLMHHTMGRFTVKKGVQIYNIMTFTFLWIIYYILQRVPSNCVYFFKTKTKK